MNWSEFYDAANLYRERQQWDEAINAYQNAIELNPNFFWSHHHLGNVLIERESWQEAVRAYQNAIELDPDFFWSHHNLGDAHTKLQQWQEAVRAYRKAIELDPDFFWSHHNLGDAHTKLQQWDEAIIAYLKAILLQELPLIRQKLGRACREKASLGLNLAIDFYRQIIRDRSTNVDRIWQTLRDNPELSIELADGLAEVHQLEGAIIFYYIALEIKPDAVEVIRRLGELLTQKKHLQSKIIDNRHKIDLDRSRLSNYQSVIDIARQPIDSTSKIIFTTNPKIEAETVEALCQSVGWASRPLSKVQKAIEGSFLVISAWEIQDARRKLVGFVRISSDKTFHATLLDVAVHPDFQSRGIGKALIQYAVQQLRDRDIEDIILFASPQIVDFYQKLGFIAQPKDLQWLLLSQ
jgi:tetratricopeptide (TPR) repeat protein